MSINRDQKVASNTSSLLDIPLKKRKGSRFGEFFPPSDGCNTKQAKKRTDTVIRTCHEEDISYPRPVKKKNYESSSVWLDDDNDDSVDTMYINPYLNHVGNNVTSQESETSHNIDSVRKGSGHLSVSDLNTADHNQKAQAKLSSSHKYFPIPDELCGIASDNDKPPRVLDLTRNASVLERNRASDMQFISDETGHSSVSSLTQKRDCTLPVSDLKKDKTAHARQSSASCKYFQVFPESSDSFTRNKMVYESSETSMDRTSGTQSKFEPTPSSVSWEDLCLFHNNSRSQKGCSSSSTLVGAHESSCLPTVSDASSVVPLFYPSSKFGTEPKLSENHSHALPLSLRPCRREHPGSEFATHTSLSKAMQLPESVPYPFYDFNCRPTVLIPKSKLHQVRHDLAQIIGRTPHFEIGTDGEVDTVSKQESCCSYEKSQDSCKKQIDEKKSIAEHQYDGEAMDTKEEKSSIEEKKFQHEENSYVSKVPCYKSGIVPVTCNEVQHAMNHHRVVNQDINKDSRKHSKEEVTVCVDDTLMLRDEVNNCRNSDYEGSVLVIGDTDDDGISVHDISDGSEDTDDDVEIVHCVSKKNVGMRNVSVQQKEQNSIINPTRNISKSSVTSNGCAIPDSAGNLTDEPRGDAQRPYWKSVWEPYYRTSKAYNDIVTNGFRFQTSTSMKPLCLEMHNETPTPTSQVLLSGDYDLSRNTVIQSKGIPASLSSVRNSFALPRKKLFSPVHSLNFPHGKSQNVPSKKYPSSSDVLSVASSGSSYTLPDEKESCGRRLVPIVDGHVGMFFYSAIPSFGTNNCVATSLESAVSVCRNSQEKSSEPDNQEILMPLKVISQLTSAHDTTLETSGVSHNLQEGKEMFQTEEILTNVSDSHGEKKQESIAEHKVETTQKGPRHEWECAICLEAINSKRGISATVCGHVYCTPCITDVVCKRKECPTCRKALDSAQVHPLYIFG